MRYRPWFSGAFAAAILTGALHAAVLAQATPPSLMHLEGRLTSNTGVPENSAVKDIRVEFWDALGGGLSLGTYTAVDPTITNGIYALTVTVPANAFANNAGVYLEISVGNGAVGADGVFETLAPRTRVLAAGYALNSDTLDGRDSTYFAIAPGSGAYVQLAPAAAQTWTNGNVGIYLNETGAGIPLLMRIQTGGTDMLSLSNSGLMSLNDDLQVMGNDLRDSSGNVRLTLGATVSTPAGGSLSVGENTTLGDAATDLVTVTGTIQGGSPLLFEGPAADANDTTFTFTAQTAPRTVTFPDATGTVALTSQMAPIGSPFVTVGNDATLTAERALSAGSGLTSADGGANASLTLNIGAGTGITVNADDIAVTYGAAAGTAVQGNQTATVTAGSGLTGGVAADALGDSFSATVNVGAGTGIAVAADSVGLSYAATLAANPALNAGESVYASTGIIFEGSVADILEGLLTVTNPTVDRTWTLPDATGTILLTSTAAGNYVSSITGGAGVDPDAASTGAVTVTADLTELTLTGLSAGGATSMSVTYGAAANTAVQGNQTATITAGSGLTGGIAADALGDGFSSTVNVGAGTGIAVAADSVGLSYAATLAANPALNAGESVYASTGIIFEGSVADILEGLLTVTNPTVDRTWTLPDATGTILLTSTAAGNYVSSITGGAGVDPDAASTGAVTVTSDLTELTLTGLSAGGATSLSVSYGTAANTAVQGNQTATITAGSGLTGGIAADALGDGFSSTVNVGAGTGIAVAADSVGLSYAATLAANPALNAGESVYASTGIIFEGSVADILEGLLTVTNPTVDRTWTLPDATGTILLTSTAAGNYVSSITGGAGVDPDAASTGVVTVTADLTELTLTGLSAGGATSMSVTYGAAANTAVQGNQTATVTAGSGLTGGVAADALGDSFSATVNVGAGTGIAVAADSVGLSYAATLAANPALNAGESVYASTGIIFEGSLADTLEGLLTVTNPTVDRTWTLPDASGTIALTGSFAPVGATYITQTADATLTAEQALSGLATGYMKVTTGTGVVTSQAVPIPISDGGTGSTTDVWVNTTGDSMSGNLTMNAATRITFSGTANASADGSPTDNSVAFTWGSIHAASGEDMIYQSLDGVDDHRFYLDANERFRISDTGSHLIGTAGGLFLGASNWVDNGATYGHVVSDNTSYKAMMIVGNNIVGNSGLGREVKVWDFLNVQGSLNTTGSIRTGAGAGTVRIDSSGVGTFAAGTTIGGSGVVSGSGSSPRLAVWTGAGTLGSSTINDNGASSYVDFTGKSLYQDYSAQTAHQVFGYADILGYTSKGIHQYGNSYIWPGRTDSVSWQDSWYLASNGSYGLYTNTGMYFAGTVYLPFAYDANDTGYYMDPNGTSQFSYLYRVYGYNGVEYDANNTGYYVDPDQTSSLNNTITVGKAYLGNTSNAAYYGNTAAFGQAAGWDPGPFQSGVFLEGGTSESGGFYADGDVAVIWSPGDSYLVRFYDEDGLPGGGLMAYIDGSGNWFTVSDMRRKENIDVVTGALDKINAISGVTYNLKPYPHETEKGQKPKKTAGVLAQEVEKVAPELVDTDERGNKFMSYDGLSAYLIEAMKELSARVDSVKEAPVQRVSDFGSEVMRNETEKWVDFSEEFSSQLGERGMPVVTLTCDSPGVLLCITEKSTKGFKVAGTVGDQACSFDWIAMANVAPEGPKPQSQATAVEPASR